MVSRNGSKSKGTLKGRRSNGRVETMVDPDAGHILERIEVRRLQRIAERNAKLHKPVTVRKFSWEQ